MVQDYSLTPVNSTASATPGTGTSTNFQWAINRINGFSDSVSITHLDIIDPQNPDPASYQSQQMAHTCPFTNWTVGSGIDNVTLYIVPAGTCSSGSNGAQYTLLVSFANSSHSVMHTDPGNAPGQSHLPASLSQWTRSTR